MPGGLQRYCLHAADHPPAQSRAQHRRVDLVHRIGFAVLGDGYYWTNILAPELLGCTLMLSGMLISQWPSKKVLALAEQPN